MRGKQYGRSSACRRPARRCWEKPAGARTPAQGLDRRVPKGRSEVVGSGDGRGAVALVLMAFNGAIDLGDDALFDLVLHRRQ